MLKLSVPGRFRRLLGHLAIGVALAGGSAIVYASGQPVATHTTTAPMYQLALSLERGSKVLATPVVCVKAGQHAAVEQSEAKGVPGWSFDLVLDPVQAAHVQVRISGTIGAPNHQVTLRPRLRGTWGEPMSARVDSTPGQPSFTLTVTPSLGCPARKG